MIQVCSRCGTRWNVRERRRAWCPRCNGALWAPLTDAQEAELQQGLRSPATAPAPAGTGRPAALAPGYRWIAVRPGPPPPPHRQHRPPGPTPHYTVIPRWTLMQRVDPSAAPSKAAKSAGQQGPSAEKVRKTLAGATVALGIAALTQAMVYGLLIVNRTILLHPAVAVTALWLAGLASLAAVAAVLLCAVLLTRWLIARRAAIFARARLPESRPRWELWAGCLVPLVNLAWAPVYVIETAAREGQLARLRKPITVWWLVWALATAVTVLATVTSRASEAQAIANNTVTMMLAYLLGAAAVVTVGRVFEGFESRPVQRPAHRWVIIADESAGEPAVEPNGRKPAA